LNIEFYFVTLTEMQKFLNEEANHFSKQFNKYPTLWFILFLYTALGVSLLSLALQCRKSFSCTYLQEYFMIWFGVLILVSLVMFVIIPNILRVFLNCLYERPKALPVKKMSPLSLSKIPVTRNPLKSVRQ
jgi:hypothetical protein